MPVAESNRAKMRYVRNAALGDSPAAGSASMKELRFTGESLAQTTGFVSSAEVRSDGQIPDNIRNAVSAAGDISGEFSFATYDDFMESILRGTWKASEASGTVIKANADSNRFYDDAASPIDFSIFSKGQWVKVEGFSSADNNGWFKILDSTGGASVTANITAVAAGVFNIDPSQTVTFEELEVGDLVAVSGSSATNNGLRVVTAVSEKSVTLSGTHATASTASVTFKKLSSIRVDAVLVASTSVTNSKTIGSDVLFNGVDKTDYTVEKHFEDVGQFDSFIGLLPGTWSLEIPSEGIITTTFGFTGFRGAVKQAATLAMTNEAANTNDVMNSIDHISMIREGGSVIMEDIVSLSMSVATNPRALSAVGNLGSIAINTGAINVTGSVTLYFENRTHVDKVRAWDKSSISFLLEDVEGNAYLMEIPTLRFNTDNFVISGGDTDITVELGFVAQIDGDISGKTIQVARKAA